MHYILLKADLERTQEHFMALVSKIIFSLLLVPTLVSASSSFTLEIAEVQVFSDRVRLLLTGNAYGTCGAKEGWWGWSTAHERHSDWLSLALTAQAQGKRITVYDEQSSCQGPVDAIGIEGLFIKS